MQAKLFGKWRSWRWKAFRGLMVSKVQSLSLPHRATKARRPPTSLSELPLASLAGDFPCHKSYSESILNKIFLSDDDGTLRSGKFLLSKDNCWYMMWFLYLKSLWIQVVIHRTSGSYRSLLFNKTCDFWWDVFTKWIQREIPKPVSRGSNLMNLFAWSAELRRVGNFYCKHQISRRHQKIEKFLWIEKVGRRHLTWRIPYFSSISRKLYSTAWAGRCGICGWLACDAPVVGVGRVTSWWGKCGRSAWRYDDWIGLLTHIKS